MDYKEKVIDLLKSQELSKEQKEKLENIFPELAESGDDKIRNFLIDYISHIDWGDWDFSRKQCIDWLEKQEWSSSY